MYDDLMVFIDFVLLPAGCILCGIMASSSLVLRFIPGISRIVLEILPFRGYLSAITIFAGLVSLFFPADGMLLLGNLFPAFFGILSGIILSVEYLADIKFLKRNRIFVIWIGNVLQWIKKPVGLLTLFLGVTHLFFRDLMFF